MVILEMELRYMMAKSGKSKIVILFIIFCCLSGTAINNVRVIDNAAAEPDQENENMTFSVYNEPSDKPFRISPLDFVDIGACEYELSASIYNDEPHNVTVNVTAWLEEKTFLCDQSISIPPHNYRSVSLKTDFSGFNISDGSHKVSMRMNNSLSNISRQVYMVNPLPGLEIKNISLPPDLHVNDMATLTLSVQNSNQSSRRLSVEIYDGRTMLNRSNVFDLPAGNGSDVSVDVRLPGPSNATHAFYFIVGGHLTSQQQFVLPPIAATIEIKGFYANPHEAPGTTGTETRRTTLYLSLWNDGSSAGTVNVTIYAHGKLLSRESVTVGGIFGRNLTYPWNVSGQGSHEAVARISGPDAAPNNSTKSTVFNILSSEVFLPRIGPIDLSIWCNTLIAIGIIVVVIIVVLKVNKKRRRKAGKDGQRPDR